MGVIERREREKEKRRNDIIDAAEKVFFSKGKDKASMDAIALEAELSKGALYHHFRSKEELYFAINYRGLLILEKMFIEATENKSTGLDKATALTEAFFNFYKQYPDYYNVLNYFELNSVDIDDGDPFTMKCHNQAKQTLSIFINALFTGLSDKSISVDVDPLKTAVVIWGQMTGVINIINLKGERMEKDFNVKREDIMNHFLEMILKILKP